MYHIYAPRDNQCNTNGRFRLLGSKILMIFDHISEYFCIHNNNFAVVLNNTNDESLKMEIIATKRRIMFNQY